MTKIGFKDYKEGIFAEIKAKTDTLTQKPQLAILSVDADDASEIYMRNKKNACEKSGILCQHHSLTQATAPEVAKKIQELNEDPTVTSIILQLPLPPSLKDQEDALTQQIAPHKDVDGFTLNNLANTFLGRKSIVGCTPLGVMDILSQKYPQGLAGVTVAVVGRGFLVGKPLVNLLMTQQATVFSINSRTKNPKNLCQSADVVVLATDQLDFFDQSYFTQGQLLIDVGIGHSPKTGEICGCLQLSSLENMELDAVVSPGGVGQLTQAMLMKNVMQLYENP